ncbi:MAG: ABC transporter permease [Bacteroidota bacterium]
MIFINSLHSEWLKTKRSFAFWLTIIGGFFIPLIYFISFLYNGSSINSSPAGMNGWSMHFMQCWQNMTAFLLPMGVIMASSLITQMEFRNNTWKQLHTTPQSFTTIFFAKLSVIMLLTLQFFIFFNIGILLSGILPCIFFDGNLSNDSIPVFDFLKSNIKFFIGCMPIIALQYLISLRFKNFLIPILIGLFSLIGSLIALQWDYIFLSPFSFCILNVMPGREFPVMLNVQWMALISFSVITLINFYLYINRKEKG